MNSYKEAIVEVRCQPAPTVWVGAKRVLGLLIAADDAVMLRALAGGPYLVCLECPGRWPVRARLQPLLARMVPVPYANEWYVSASGTGPLYAE